MPSTNGSEAGPKAAVLYARVSTEEQARTGYSLAQQLEALRAYAVREGYEILEEVADPGQGGASLERPGMDRVRDLVAAEKVSVVLAQDRDRFSREPAYTYLLRREFEEHGTSLRSLNDRGDDSPEGDLTDGILDQLAKYERAKTAERTRRGRLRKAREGKVLAIGPRPTYGFKYNVGRDGYLLDEEEIRTVRRIFELVGGRPEGMQLYTVKSVLEREGVPAPNGQRWWNTRTIRDIVEDDCYRPHTFEEIGTLVSKEVASRLDPDALYGVWWYNRRRTTTRQVAEDGPEGRRYRKVQRTSKKARSEWVAVPIPAASVPREWVEAAREHVRHNSRTSAAGDVFWELSGGVFFCGGCGNRMVPHRARRSPDSAYIAYYRCETRKKRKNACPMPKSYRSDKIEPRVWEFVSALLKDPEVLREGLEAMIEEEKKALRGEPDREARIWLSRLAELDRKRSGFQDMAAEGLIDFDELRSKLAALQEARETAEKELEMLRGRREKIEELERDRDALLEHYSTLAPEAIDEATPEERHQIYHMLRLRVVAYPDGSIEANGEYVGDPSSAVCTTRAIFP